MDEIKSASWNNRFWAWLIDVMLMSIPWYLVITILKISAVSVLGFGYQGMLMFLYWTILEGYRGQSIGKMFQNIVVVGAFGEKIGIKDAALESFGKAFLLPLDCLIGWLAIPASGQRLFNNISNTIVTIEIEECAMCYRT